MYGGVGGQQCQWSVCLCVEAGGVSVCEADKKKEQNRDRRTSRSIGRSVGSWVGVSELLMPCVCFGGRGDGVKHDTYGWWGAGGNACDDDGRICMYV